MEVSPPPTPRKTVQRRQSTTPSRRLPLRASVSRFATPPVRGPAEKLSTVADEDEVEVASTSMDVDGADELMDKILKSETVFAKSAELQVTFYSHLPGEVKQVLRNADFYQDAYTGDIDTETGFALVASAETCFVWKYTQALTGTPTCYIFSCPQDADVIHMATPLHALVPYGSSREPGLILVTPGGHVRFWDSLGIGLAGGEHYTTITLDLVEDERVTTLTRADAQTYIVSTSAGRLFRLTLTSLGGRHHLTPRVFSRPQSALSLSRLLPTFFSSDSVSGKGGNINAVALEPNDKPSLGRHVWALIDFRIQRWNMSPEGWEELDFDEDLADLIRPALRARFASASEDDSELDLELLDLQLVSSEELLLLVSYAGHDDSGNVDVAVQPRRIYAIVGMQHSATSFQVKDVKSVPYQSTSSSGAPTHPRLKLLATGKIVVIQFGDTVTLCARNNVYMDRLELKSATDRTLGVGVMEGDSDLLVLTAATLMKTWVDTDAVERFDPETGRANLVRNIMTQAILFGSYPGNPLHFSFPPEIDEDALMNGAELLSTQVLRSDSSIIRGSHDLHAQMTTRKERLSFLIKFINDNAVLTKMSQRSRQKLATDAETLYAAHQLWLRHNEILASGSPHGILTEAVELFMEGHNYQFKDNMRAFFKFHVESLGSLLPAIMELIQRAAAADADAQSLLINLSQANNVVLTILQSTISYRHYNLGVYGVELPMIRPWTSLPRVINIISELLNITVKWVELPSTEIEPARAKALAKEQLPELAQALFSCYQEQLDWLSSPLAANDAANERTRSDLEDKFRHARPEVLEVLRRNGFAEDAFRLAENFRDFRSLASLCHKDQIYPPQSNPNALRIQTYVDKFKDEFTTELFQWYIEHGELRSMFAQDTGPYLDAYFAEHPHPNISWIQDLVNRRYDEASRSLLADADVAHDLSAKHLMLSIGKLAHLAQVQEEEPRPINEGVLDAFHDGLDFVSVHENLLTDLKTALASARAKQSFEQQVDTIVRAKASHIGNVRALQSSFRQLVRRMLQGQALSVEDAADVLSLKDNDGSLEDFVTALHLVNRDHILPEARRISATKTIWRRIYIHDDWIRIQQTANVTDAEVNDRFRNTALCAVLQTLISQLQLRPSQLKGVPTRGEIASRWPGLTQDDVEALYRDCEWESQRLDELGLDDEVYERVKELAEELIAQS